MKILINLWRSIRRPAHERNFTEVVRAWSEAITASSLDGQFEAVRSRYHGAAELGGEFPYLSIVVQGGNLDLYYPLSSPHPTRATLLRRLEGDYRDAHRLGMLARCATEMFLPMVRKLTAEGSEQRTNLLRLIDEPGYNISPEHLAAERALWLNVEEWANTNLPTLWGKVRRISGYFGLKLKACACSQGVPDDRLLQIRDDNLHLLIVHDDAAAAFDTVFNGKAREVFAGLQKNNWEPGVVTKLAGHDFESLFSRDTHGLRQIMEQVIEFRIHSVTSRKDLIVPARIVV